MVRPELVVAATLLISLVLVFAGTRWAWTRSSVKLKDSTQNTSWEQDKCDVSTKRNPITETTMTQSFMTESELSSTHIPVMETAMSQSFMTESELSSTRSPVMETSTTQSFMTEVYSVLSNTTESSSMNRSTEILVTDRSMSEQPTARHSFNNTSDKIFLNHKDLVTDSTVSTESPDPLHPQTGSHQILTPRPQIGFAITTKNQIKEANKPHSANIERHSNLTGNNYFLHTTNSSNLVINNTERIERLEYQINSRQGDQLKALNESGGFANVSLRSTPESLSHTAPLNKPTVHEVLEQVNQTTIATVTVFENVVVPRSVEPSGVGLNSSSGDVPVNFGVGQNDNSSQATNSTDDDVDYVKMGQELVSEAITVLDTGIWDFERRTEDGDVIFSRTLDNGNTVYRLTGIVDMPAQDLLVIIYDGLADYPKWNPTLLECRVLEKINDQTDISYTVSAPGARGYVASRDFISLRHWDVYQHTYVAATKSIDFQNAPFNPDYIRGQNGAGCMELRPLSSDPFKTEFRWLLNTRLNGWIPSYIADKAYKKFMTKYMVFLREYCKKVKQRAAEALTPNGNITTPLS